MGDIADYMIDQMIEQGMRGRAQPRRPRSAGHAVTCNRCGAKNLEWGADGKGGWYLIDRKGDRHQCSTPQEDFA